MGLIDTGINILESIKYNYSNDSFVVGQRFENYVNDLFSKKYFSIVEKTNSTKTNQKQYVESSMNPDFVYKYIPTGHRPRTSASLSPGHQLDWRSGYEVCIDRDGVSE